MSLEGIQVLDLTRLLPGAFCTLLLADLRADVIKVEAPGEGDYMRWTPPLIEGQSVLFNALNRNKRSLTLNLKTPSGQDLLLRLVERADVLVEGNRPGVMARLGLGWPSLQARNHRLVMCSITGYGQDGPFASRAGHDLNYMATVGALGLNGPRGEGPVPLSVQVADIGGGGLAPAVDILAALVAVQRGAPGRWIDSSMTDAALGWMAPALAARAAGEKEERGAQRLAGRYACYRIYACRGGGYYSVAALEPKFWASLCLAVARPEWIAAQYEEGPSQDDLQRAMEDMFVSRTRDEWSALLAPLDCCCEPVMELDEVAAHPHIAARRLIDARPTGVEVRPAGQSGDDWRRRDAPTLGQHAAEILTGLGVAPEMQDRLRREGVI